MPLKMNVRQLPSGWAEKKLGDVCEKVEYGSSAKSKQEGEIPVLRMGNIQNGAIDWKDLVYTTNQEEIDKYLLKHNDVLFNRTNSDEHVGKSAVYKSERPAIFAGYLIRIHRKEDLIDADFLNYYLNSHTTRQYGKSVMSRSVNQANINGTKLRDYPILVPPLLEQKRIVSIVDQAFEGIDRAIANTKKNLTNARELFESYLNAIFTQEGDGWVNAVIEDHIKFIDYRGRTPNKTEEGMRLITAKNVKMGFLQTEPQEFVDPRTYDKWMTRGIPQKGNVLFTTEAPLGNVAQLDTDEKVVFAQRVIIMQPDAKFINSTFLKFLLLSNTIQQRIQDRGTGATAQGIKASLLKRIPISFPCEIRIQEETVLKLETLETQTQRLEAIYRQKLAALTELKQSILQKAFTGELTADTANQTTKNAEEAIAA